MGVAVRHYIFPEKTAPVRISERVIEGLVHGKDALPQFADSRQKVLTVFVEIEDGKLLKIYRSEGSIWTFDDAGDITGSLQESLALAMNSAEWSGGEIAANVVSIDKKLQKKRLLDEFRWSPSAADLDIVARDIWAKSQSDRLKLASGVSKRKPPITWEAEKALRECSESFWKIPHTIAGLKGPSLKAFLSPALLFSSSSATMSPSLSPLWQLIRLPLSFQLWKMSILGLQ